MARELTALEKLIQNPRKVKVINVLDGTTQDVPDDGAAVTSDGIFENSRRQNLLQLLKKTSRGYANDKSKPKEIVYILAERVTALYPSDPVARHPVLNKEWQAKIDANLKLREARLSGFVPSIEAEVKAHADAKGAAGAANG